LVCCSTPWTDLCRIRGHNDWARPRTSDHKTRQHSSPLPQLGRQCRCSSTAHCPLTPRSQCRQSSPHQHSSPFLPPSSLSRPQVHSPSLWWGDRPLQAALFARSCTFCQCRRARELEVGAEVVQGARQGSRGISGGQEGEGGLRLGEGVGDRQQEGQRGGLGEPQESHGRWHRAQEVGGLGGEV